MDKLTTTIERQWLREIVALRKKVEYREIKKYWTDRLNKVRTPFLLRLINGMVARAPEVTVRIDKVRKNARSGNYELHVGRIVEVRYLDRRRERPRVKQAFCERRMAPRPGVSDYRFSSGGEMRRAKLSAAALARLKHDV